MYDLKKVYSRRIYLSDHMYASLALSEPFIIIPTWTNATLFLTTIDWSIEGAKKSVQELFDEKKHGALPHASAYFSV